MKENWFIQKFDSDVISRTEIEGHPESISRGYIYITSCHLHNSWTDFVRGRICNAQVYYLIF